MIIKVKCSNCGLITRLKEREYLRLLKLNGPAVRCSEQHCQGTVFPSGQKIKKSRTAAKYPSYQWRLDRPNVKRDIRKPQRYLDDKVSEKELDEETEEDGAMTLDDAAKVDLADEWTPSPEFNPAMRLTQERMEDFGQVALSGATKGSVKDIAPPINGERQKSTRLAMGGKQAWMVACSAQKGNAKFYRLGSQDYYEWCHLHGDRLGGTCDPSNLVAAHYAVNTYMLAIEEVIATKTTHQTCVLAYCTTPDVADAIVYRVLRKSDSRQVMEIVIDGRITRFSQIDYDTVQAKVRNCFK